MKHYPVILVLALPLLLGACSTSLVASAIGYHNGLELGTGKTYAVIAKEGQENDLEFRHYAQIVNQQLSSHGLRQSDSLPQADYRVLLDYGVDDGKEHTEIRSMRVGGYGDKDEDKSYYIPYTSSYMTYGHSFALEMQRNDAGRQAVYQGEVSKTSRNDDFTVDASCLILALFRNFPGTNGERITVLQPREQC